MARSLAHGRCAWDGGQVLTIAHCSFERFANSFRFVIDTDPADA